MVTLVNNPHAVSGMVEMLGRMDISLQDLQTADEFPVAQTMIDNISHPPSDFFVKHDTYESPEAQWYLFTIHPARVYVPKTVQPPW